MYKETSRKKTTPITVVSNPHPRSLIFYQLIITKLRVAVVNCKVKGSFNILSYTQIIGYLLVNWKFHITLLLARVHPNSNNNIMLGGLLGMRLNTV